MHEEMTYDDEMTEEEARENEQAILEKLGDTLFTKVQKEVTLRGPIEQRWLEDLYQYNGEYDQATEEKLTNSKQSKVFVNITRAKCNSAEARLSDMLFPTDDKSWAIKPTPVPELAEEIGNEEPIMDEATGQPQVDPETGEPVTRGDLASGIERAARERAEKMEREIDDQLTEAKYDVMARDVIHDAVIYGTGIIKGPVVVNRTRKQWKTITEKDDEGNPVEYSALEIIEDLRPGLERVEVWDYYPDMSARTPEEKEYDFERKYLTKKQLRQLAKRPGYMRDQIAKILQEDPRTFTVQNTHLQQLRHLAGITNLIDDSRYELWEYNGPVDPEELRACGCKLPEDKDELAMMQIEATVLFIGQHVIKANLNPLETNESLYSIFVWERDDTMLFGRGVPRTMRQPQRVINAAWRMTMDNAGLSVGPQVVVNTTLVEPADGVWELAPRKLWYLKEPDRRVDEAFYTFDIPSHQAELSAIFATAKELVDEEASLPMIAQGELGPQNETATARSIAMNASNIVLRRVVKMWDDEITKTLIGRFYDWNMQNSDKNELKGDFEVDARGTSVLLVKEIQTQALMALLDYTAHPVYGPLLKAAALLRKTVQSQQIPPDEIVKTDDEIKADAAEQQKNKQPDPEQMKAQANLQGIQMKIQADQQALQAKLADAQMERQARAEERAVELQTEMMKLAQEHQLSMAQIEAKLKEVMQTTQTKRDLAAAEMVLKRAMGTGI